MMRKLLYRDWILNRRVVLFTAVIFLGFIGYEATEMDSARVYAVLLGIMMAFMPVFIITREDKFHAMVATCVLPVTREEIVQARYIGAWILMTMGFLSALTLAMFLPNEKLSGTGLFSPGIFFSGLAALGLFSAFMLPFVIRFGVMGIMIFLVASQGLGVIVLLFGMLAGSRNGTSQKGTFSAGIAQLGDILVFLHQMIGSPAFYSLLVIVLLLLNFAAFKISTALFRRREL